MKQKGVMGVIGLIAFILILLGALNWGLVGLFNFNLVTVIFGYGMVTNVIYVIIGVAALYKIIVKLTMKKTDK